jgi:4-hydroxybenzoate polyprenyltransferase
MNHVGPVEEPTVTGAIDRVVDAAQGLVADEVALARVQIESTLVGAFTGSALLLIGICFALGAWTVAMIAAYELLITRMTPLTSLGIVAAVNVVVAIAFIASGAARLRQPSAPALDRR